MLTISADKNETVAAANPSLMAAIGKPSEDMTKAGVLLESGGYLSGARLRLAGGTVTATDGPFTEAKELVGGYAIVEVGSRDAAIEIGRQFLELHAQLLGPSYHADSEIRQLLDLSNLAPAAGREIVDSADRPRTEAGAPRQ